MANIRLLDVEIILGDPSRLWSPPNVGRVVRDLIYRYFPIYEI